LASLPFAALVVPLPEFEEVNVGLKLASSWRVPQ
jgi:hypothetical protein